MTSTKESTPLCGMGVFNRPAGGFFAAVESNGHTKYLGKFDSKSSACSAVQDALAGAKPKAMFHYY
jgi:hypothetical protein